MRLLVRAVGQEGGDLPSAYWNTLAHLQRWPFDTENAPLRLWFAGHEPAAQDALLLRFLQQQRLEPGNVYSPREREAIRAGIAGALQQCAVVAPDALEVMRLLVAVVLLARQGTHGGASRGDALGVLWLAPDPRWAAADHADALWHETVHQALFLEQMVRGLYAASVEQMATEEAQVASAIRRTRRPFDLALHAACVASALVDLNLRLGRLARCEELLRGMDQTLPQLRERCALLSGNGRRLLDELVEQTGRQQAALAACASAGSQPPARCDSRSVT